MTANILMVGLAVFSAGLVSAAGYLRWRHDKDVEFLNETLKEIRSKHA